MRGAIIQSCGSGTPDKKWVTDHFTPLVPVYWIMQGMIINGVTEWSFPQWTIYLGQIYRKWQWELRKLQ